SRALAKGDVVVGLADHVEDLALQPQVFLSHPDLVGDIPIFSLPFARDVSEELGAGRRPLPWSKGPAPELPHVTGLHNRENIVDLAVVGLGEFSLLALCQRIIEVLAPFVGHGEVAALRDVTETWQLCSVSADDAYLSCSMEEEELSFSVFHPEVIGIAF